MVRTFQEGHEAWGLIEHGGQFQMIMLRLLPVLFRLKKQFVAAGNKAPHLQKGHDLPRQCPQVIGLDIRQPSGARDMVNDADRSEVQSFRRD